MNYVGGDFFIEVPGGGDAYLLAQILHDWNDERSVAILRQCRRVVPAQGRLLVMKNSSCRKARSHFSANGWTCICS